MLMFLCNVFIACILGLFQMVNANPKVITQNLRPTSCCLHLQTAFTLVKSNKFGTEA